MIQVDLSRVYLDYALIFRREALVISVYERSHQMVRSFCANINLKKGKSSNLRYNGTYLSFLEEYEVFIQPIQCGKEKVYHALMISKKIADTIFLTTDENAGCDFYKLLMKKYDYPLMEWWGEHLLRKGIRNRNIDIGYGGLSVLYGKNAINEGRDLCGVPLKSLKAHSLDVYDEDILKDHIKELFLEKKIWISKKPQKPFSSEMTMDEYFNQYGHTIASNLEKKLKPLQELDGTMEGMTMLSMRLYPQQCAVVNGAVALLEKSSYCIQNEGMGTGKTAQSLAIAEKYMVRQWLKKHPGKTVKDVYSSLDTVKYRHVVMCPGHLVRKWANEIRAQIPFADVVELTEFRQLVELRNKGPKRTGKEFYVMSMDFGKLTYMQQPVPTKIKHNATLHYKKCVKCKSEYLSRGDTCPYCSQKGFTRGSVFHITKGLVCPECGEMLFAQMEEEGTSCSALNVWDFATPTVKNSKCFSCGANLWQPFVKNINTGRFLSSVGTKTKKWVRASHYANKAKKAVKSVWVLSGHEDDYFSFVGQEPLSIKEDMQGVRKYAPTQFIKKYMKGFFDIAILDELHKYKGGGTGQGNAMDALVKASKKQLALTGTIAGGMADHLFYLLYRLEPRRMREAGYKWGDAMKFAEDYGSIERFYSLDEDNMALGTTVRGRQLGSARSKPGISPRLFTDFLLDRAVFLDLSDMSKFLPPLLEKIVAVPLDESCTEMVGDYKSVLKILDDASKEDGGFGLSGSKLLLSLSYLDKPFGETVIKSPSTGNVVCYIPQHEYLWDDMLPKEKKLIELVKSELKEGRNCVVFAEFTRSPLTCVSYRLKELIEKYTGVKALVMESSSPAPLEREEWMHEQTEKHGIRVFITNPRCTETGLDFIWTKNGTTYNFPTLIFYQLGYSLFTIWQASRRSYRLVQKEECRVFYMAYEDTIQMEVVSLIAEKQVATSAIQGKFSTEGIAAMAKGVDAKVRLAAALSSNDFGSSSAIQDMFDVMSISRNDDGTYDGFEPMKILKELIGEELEQSLLKEFRAEFDYDAFFDELFMELNEEELCSNPLPALVKVEEPKKKVQTEGLDIFSLFA